VRHWWVIACVLAARPVHADPKPWAAGVSDEEQAKALAMYKDGNVEFEESRYAQALTKYREALTHWDHPAIRFNMAVCLVNLDQPLEAYEDLQKALAYAEAPLGADAYAQGLTYKKLLLGQLAHLEVTSDVDAADVTLDGKPLIKGVGKADQMMLPGPHQIVASKPGFETETTSLVLLPGKDTVHAVKLAPIKVSTRTVRRWKARTPWLVVGGGAGVALVGGVFELLSHGEYQTFNQLFDANYPMGTKMIDPSIEAHRSTGRWENIAGLSLITVGGAAAIAGLVGVYLNQPHSVIEHGPMILPTGNGAVASWTF
jgi:hypothetical protein